jgi:adenosine deaminase
VTLSGEYLLLHQKFGFTVAELLTLIDFGFRGAFVDEGMKTRLRIEAFLRSIKVLEKHGIEAKGLNELYYSHLGLTVPPVFHPPVKNPPLPLPLIQQLPKADLDCRLIGSVPLPVMYKLYSELPDNERNKLAGGKPFVSLEDFRAFLAKGSNERLPSDVKNLLIALLQTEANLREAVHALLYEAFVDKVLYLELTVSPIEHLRSDLSMEGTLDCILNEIEKFTANHEMRIGIVINANIEKLNPLDVHKLAELAVAYQGRGVLGFATTNQEIGVDQMRFFEATFEYLSTNFVPVTIFAGETDTESVPCALIGGHARRISGGLTITKSESVLSDVTSLNTVVLIAHSPSTQQAVHGWKRSLVRYFTDFGVKLAFCSLNHAFTNISRSEQLFVLGERAGFDALAVLKLIDRTFRAALIPYKEKQALTVNLWKSSRKLLTDYGFPYTMDYNYFPPLK